MSRGAHRSHAGFRVRSCTRSGCLAKLAVAPAIEEVGEDLHLEQLVHDVPQASVHGFVHLELVERDELVASDQGLLGAVEQEDVHGLDTPVLGAIVYHEGVLVRDARELHVVEGGVHHHRGGDGAELGVEGRRIVSLVRGDGAHEARVTEVDVAVLVDGDEHVVVLVDHQTQDVHGDQVLLAEDARLAHSELLSSAEIRGRTVTYYNKFVQFLSLCS